MNTIISHSDLLRRAIAYIAEVRSEHPEKPWSVLIDEAAMRFNLSPLDTEALLRILAEENPSDSH